MKHALDYLENVDCIGLEAAPIDLMIIKSGVLKILNNK